MMYREGQVGSIRNAQGGNPTGNGRASVNSPCGGATTFGSNGIGTLKDGDTVTLDMRYAAGHNGQFRMAYACTGDKSGSELEGAGATLNGCTVEGAASAYGPDGATAIGQDTMSITCKLPEQGNTAPVDCILGILDQRDWGGCVDVSVVPAQAALPPSPPPAPFVSSSGSYYFSLARKVDTAAGEVPGIGTFTCCGINRGKIDVPDYNEIVPDGTPLTVTWSGARAENCPASVPNKQLPPPPNTGSYPLTGNIVLTSKENGNKYTGIAYMAAQPFEVVLSAGTISFTNSGGDQPIVCDGVYSLNDGALPGTPGYEDNNNQGSGDGGDRNVTNWGYAAIALVVILSVAMAYCAYQKYCKAGAKAPPAPVYSGEMSQGQPPPGAPPNGGQKLPPGWTASVDPSSGATYYINQATGASTWTNPSSSV